MSDIQKELEKARISKDCKDAQNVFNKLNELSKELTDMDILKFLEYREYLLKKAEYLQTGPYKKPMNNIEAKFLEALIEEDYVDFYEEEY